MKLITSAAAWGIVAFAGGAVSLGDVAYNNSGPGDSYNSGSGYILYGPQSPVGARTNGFRFVAGAPGRITRLVVPLRHNSGDNSYSFEIFSDGAGMPGTSLGVIAVSPGLVWSNPPAPPPLQIASGGSVVLASGTTYWLVGSGSGTAQGGWFQNDQNVVGARVYALNGGAWNFDTQIIAAFRIEVTPPCPADYDQNGQLEPADVSLFVTTWFTSLTGGTLAGDFDHNGSVEPADVSLFVSTWFAALTSGC